MLWKRNSRFCQGINPLYIGLEVKSTNLKSAVTSVLLDVGEKPPVIKPVETTTPEKTTPPEETKEAVTETITETEPAPGFEFVPVLLVLPFLLWFRRRHRRK